MLAHGAPRLGRILVGNTGHDARMLVLDAPEISPPLGRRVNRKPHALARNDQATEEGEEARELAVAGVNCAFGLNTPPVGTTQFVGCAIGGISVGQVMRTILPFYGALIAALLLVTYVPAFSLALPNLFLGKF
jgi:hypothetical protein